MIRLLLIATLLLAGCSAQAHAPTSATSQAQPLIGRYRELSYKESR